MADNSKRALIFGASGIIGWGITNVLLSGYPEKGVFSDVTIAVNRPVSESDLFLPETPGGPKLQIATGVDLRNTSPKTIAAQLKDKLTGIEKITHVFYFVFTAIMDDQVKECQLNTSMMERVAGAMNIAAPKLKSFVYAGGTRGYGIYIPNGTFEPPLVESMADNLPGDYKKTVAYPHYRRILTEASKGHSWTWTEICPDAVVGFTPNGSGFSLALHWGQYLSLYARNHRGQDSVEVPFPGIEAAYNAKFTPVSTRILGEIAVYAALNQSNCGGKILNAADREAPTTWSELWPKIVADFGMVGIGPVDQDTLIGDDKLKPGEYVSKYRHLFEDAGLPKGMTCGVGDGHQQLDHVGTWLTFDRQLSLGRLRSVGFDHSLNPVNGWLDAFKKFREAGIIFK
ncbi:sirq protein [Fusarium austroafricanum]|uniref:Sirq protein n=1 Tax=Fusarium austroafricanum TaxID=2364996 RepID=A0A8H4KF18_9HYPO|nr:sirq protein [Fusarium austroafricanum]